MTAPNNNSQWHLDRRVPLALIIAILIQSGGFIWFFSKLDSRVAVLEDNYRLVAAVPIELERLNSAVDSLNNTLVAVNEELSYRRDRMDRQAAAIAKLEVRIEGAH